MQGVNCKANYSDSWRSLKPKPNPSKEQWQLHGPTLSDKSSKRIQIRTALLFLVFGSGFLWKICISKSNMSDASAGDFAVDVQTTSRRLHSPSDEACIDGLTRKEKDERDSISLLMVRTTHVRSIGCPTGKDLESVCLKEEYTGYIVFYLFGIIYMFVALAIICDEFFVPALETFVDLHGISTDVAGATFMAAGGSMPELFTSFIATFQETDVGFAAIVGSAVFNVLFVIAVCAIASTEVLVLTAWPLARDCSFYVLALGTVVFVFQNTKNRAIEAWEAILLLAIYVGYCTFMRFNGKILCWFIRTAKVQPSDEAAESNKAEDEDKNGVTFGQPSKFRKGIVTLLTKKVYLYERAGLAAVTQYEGDLKQTFDQIDCDNDGEISLKEFENLLEKLGVNVQEDRAGVKTALRRVVRKGNKVKGNTDADLKLSYEDFKKWYLASEQRIEMEVRGIFDKIDVDQDGKLEKQEVRQLLKEMGHSPAEEDITEALREIKKSNIAEDGKSSKSKSFTAENSKDEIEIDDQGVTFDEFNTWYTKSLLSKGKRDQQGNDDEEDGSLTLFAPDDATTVNIIWYVLTYPICAMLYCTLPDVRKPKWKHSSNMAVLAFLLSLVWIGIFSNALYEWTVICSNTLGIPPPVAAVTFLAAGTSIPDLISSYIVATHGEGDMAVSSSIGSNIFDVTIGLPLPWLCFNIIKGKHVRVQSDNLAISMIVLIFMLCAVVVTMICMKWKMTKCMGYIMLVLYGVFIIQDLLQQLPPDKPILKIR